VTLCYILLHCLSLTALCLEITTEWWQILASCISTVSRRLKQILYFVFTRDSM